MAETQASEFPDKPYVPIDTDLVDDLEHYALDKIHVTIAYRTGGGEAREMRGLIGEVFTKDHAEYLRMEDGRLIRLDQIVHVEPKGAH